VEYYPGYVGLNNLKVTDGVNTVLQALAHIVPIRNYFLSDAAKPKSNTLIAFRDLLRKMWNTSSFKGHVSPHDLLQSLSAASERKFRIGQVTDPIEFITWFINYMHRELLNESTSQRNKKKLKSSIVSQTVQGLVTVTSQQIASQEDEYGNTIHMDVKLALPSTRTVPFNMLTLDMPPAPLFKDDYDRNILPQVPLYNLLTKFDGKTETTTTVSTGVLEKKIYTIKKLPQYLIFQIKRFSMNKFFKEKNPTIVNFPLTNLELSDVLKNISQYNLIANIVHEGDAISGIFKIHLLHKATNKWLEIQDLHVQEILPQMVSVSESNILVYEKVTNK
jgi:U4/U6.U5 tri-snRNP-associated protein 2